MSIMMHVFNVTILCTRNTLRKCIGTLINRHVSSAAEDATAMLDGSFGSCSELTDSLCDLVNVLR